MKPTLFQILVLLFILLSGCKEKRAGEESPAETVEETFTDTTAVTSAENAESRPDSIIVPVPRQSQTTSTDRPRVGRMTMDRGPVIRPVPDLQPQEPLEVRREEIPVKAVQDKKLAVHCPRSMIYKKTSDVIAFVADLIDDDVIIDMMERRVADATDREDVDINDQDMLIKDLQLYEFIELKLDDADNRGFLIKKIHETDKQKVSEDMEGWHWKVTPNTSDEEQQLVLKVIVYDENGEFKSFNKTYRINIKIESGLFIRNTYALAVENPEWAIATIIIPFLTFLWGRYKAVRSNRKKEDEE